MLRAKVIVGCLLGFVGNVSHKPLHAQVGGDPAGQPLSRVDTLGLTPAETSALKHALELQDDAGAERLLLNALQKDSRSPRAARLLNFAGAVYFLDHDDFNAAIAWKKSEQIAPLEPSVQFSLAMAYVRLRHPEWASAVLSSLSAQNPKNAVYLYWLGRLYYDAHRYDLAIAEYKRAIALAPAMARAYEGLGLCFFYENQNALAIENYQIAIALDRQTQKPSAWPYLDLALTQQFLHQTSEAEQNLREAIRLDPNFSQAHFHLGNMLAEADQTEAAVTELKRAVQLDPGYAEPHFTLARMYNRLGQKREAQAEVETYHRLHDMASTRAAGGVSPTARR